MVRLRLGSGRAGRHVFLYNLFHENVSEWLPEVIGYMLILVGIAVIIRTLVSIRGLLGRDQAPHGRAAQRTTRSWRS